MLASFRRSPALTAQILLICVVVVWGTTFTLVKAALQNVSPLVFNFLRMLLAFAVLAAWNWRSLRNASRQDLRAGCAVGLLLAMGYQFQTVGLTRTTPTKSAFITGLVVVLAPLLENIPGARPPGMPATRWNGFAGAGIAFAGLVFLTTPPHRETLLSGIGTGEVLTFLCALSFAGHLLVLAHFSREMDARRLGTLQVGAAAFLMLLTVPAESHPLLHWNTTVAFALLVTSVLATAAAFTIQSWAQKHISSTNAALIFTLEPVFAWLTSLIFLGEKLNTRGLEGACLILSGILLSQLLPAKTSRTVALQPEQSSLQG